MIADEKMETNSRVLTATDDGNYVGMHDITSMPSPRSDHTVVLFDLAAFGMKPRMYISNGCNGNQLVQYNQTCPLWSNTAGETLCVKSYCTAITASTVYFTPDTSEFTTVSAAAPSGARYRAAAAGVGRKLYIFGGRTLPSPLGGDDMALVVANVDILDTVTNEWDAPVVVGQAGGLASALSRADIVSDGGAFSSGNCIYLVGGYDSTYAAVATLIRIDVTQTPSWDVTTLSPMPTPRGDITVQLFRGEFYVMGGWNSAFSEAVTTVESYKIDSASGGTGTWTSRPSMKYARGDLASGVISNALFAIAGEQRDAVRDPLGDKRLSFPVQWVTKFTLSSNEFVDEQPLTLNRFRFVGASYNSSSSYLSSAIYLFGGQSDYDPECSCYKTVSTTLKYIPVSTYTRQFSGRKLSDGDIAGIVIGTLTAAGCILLAVVSYILYRKRGYFTKQDVQLSSMQMQKLGGEGDDTADDVEVVELGGAGHKHVRL